MKISGANHTFLVKTGNSKVHNDKLNSKSFYVKKLYKRQLNNELYLRNLR